MKNIIAINGSPRKNNNTAKLLKKALEGASSIGAQGEIINLYDLNFKGCVSCFACKLKGGASYGKCGYKDELSPVLSKIEKADALILGTPVYFGNATGEFRSFMERLFFQYFVYDKTYSSLNKNKIPAAIVYTMNITEPMMKEWKYRETLGTIEQYIKKTFGNCESLFVTDTMQFNDYSKYVCEVFDPLHKAEQNKEEFPKDLEKAFELGKRLCSN